MSRTATRQPRLGSPRIGFARAPAARPNAPRGAESGVVLVNVLVVLAVTSGLVMLMLGTQERAIDRVSRSAALAQAEQIALGAEASVLAALRADLETGPDADHLSEPWAQVLQEPVELPDGRFSVTVRDAQAKYDVNALAGDAVGPQIFFSRLLTALDLPPELALQIRRGLSVTGPLEALEDLTRFGVSDAALARLAPHVTALPVPGRVNLNTADPLLMSVLFDNPGIAAQLVRRRASQGSLDRETLAAFGALRPENSGFVSNVWDVEIEAEAGQARIRMRTRILRRDALSGQGVAVHRRGLIAAPSPALD